MFYMLYSKLTFSSGILPFRRQAMHWKKMLLHNPMYNNTVAFSDGYLFDVIETVR